MVLFDFIREISQSVGNNKTRTVLTGIAVSWGIFILIVLLGMSRGLTNTFETEILSNNPSNLRIFPGETSVPFRGTPAGRQVYPETGDISVIRENDPDYVEEISAVISGSGILRREGYRVEISYSGVVPEDVPRGNKGEMAAGRFINGKDVADGERSIVLPMRYARELFPPDGKDALGKRVDLKDLSFLVVGIYDSRWNRDVFLPYTTAQRLSPDKKRMGEIKVGLRGMKTEEDGDEREGFAREALAKKHKFSPDDKNALFIANTFKNALQVLKVAGIIGTCVWVLGILTLLSGIVGVSNIMFVTVRERRHEIGIRRAIGAKPWKILMQFVMESVAITVVFGYIGIVAGMAVTQLMSTVLTEGEPFTNPTVSLAIALEVTGVLVLAGALAGLFPAVSALKVKPVEALHDE